MSWTATAYVKTLQECPDGAALDAGHKLLLFVLADYHNTELKRAYPSIRSLARDALISYDTCKRYLDYLEKHLVIEQHHPEHQGAGMVCWYSIMELDEPARLKVRLYQMAKGVQSAPLFSGDKRGAEGVQNGEKRGAEGVHSRARSFREPKPIKQPKPTRAPARDLSMAELSANDNLRTRTTAELNFIVQYWRDNNMGEPEKVVAELRRRKGVN
jgi:hypothetical protein